MSRAGLFACLSCVLISAALFRVTTGQKVEIQDVRLSDGNVTAGRVEVRVNGVWGTVCDDDWDDQEAIVTCRGLGLFGGVALKNAAYGQGTGTIFMDSTYCAGNENSLGECFFTSNSNCEHNEDVSVICQRAGASPPPTTTTTPQPAVTQPSNCNTGNNAQANVRLFGVVKGIGYVQVRGPNGQFGFVCDDFWNTNAAKVVCNELCYNISQSEPGMKKEFQVAVNNPTYFLDNVKCVGTESTLSQCPHDPWYQHDCGATELAAVSCAEATYPTPPTPSPILECRNASLIAGFNKSRDPNLEPKHLSVENPGSKCSFGVENADPNIMIAKIPFEECNTGVKQNETHIIYTNAILMKPTTQEGSITRSNTFLIKLTCEMPRDDKVGQEVEPLTQVVTQKTEGKFIITMKIFEDRMFTQPTPAYPFQLDLGQWVNAAVELESNQDSRLKLVVTNCAAKADNTDNSPSKPLVVDKCPSDSSTMEVYPLSQLKMGLRFQSFVFVNYPTMFVECETIVCLTREITSECDRSCNSSKPAPTPSGRKRRGAIWEEAGRERRDLEAVQDRGSSSREVYKVTTTPIIVNVHPLSSSTAAASNTTSRVYTVRPSSTTRTPSTPTTTSTTPSTTTTMTTTTTTTTTARKTTTSSSGTSTTHSPVTVIEVTATGTIGTTVRPADTTTQRPLSSTATQRPLSDTTTQRPLSDTALQSPDLFVHSAATWHTVWLFNIITALLCVCLAVLH